jgi:imipenem/basic amino acid-specific outer membrane pore
MRKLAKLSLVAAVAVAGLSTSAVADSLAEAFAASKVKGEIKSQYFQKETKEATNAESNIWVNGGNLSLTTGSFNGLTAGVTFQTSHVATIDDDNNNYAGDMDASGSVMSEAYLAYTMNNTTAKVGRQYITTPLVAGSGSRMFKQSFEGIVLVNTDVPNTTLVAAYADKFQARTDGAGGEPEFNQVADGAYTVYAKNTSIANLAVQAQYAHIEALTGGDDVDVIYVDADYKLDSVTLSGQTFQSDNGAAVNSDGALYGAKVVGNIAGVTATAAYTTTDDEAKVVNGLGSGADKSYTASPINGGNYTADTDSYQVGLGYKFNMGLGLNASYTNWDNNATNSDSSETNVTASYAFNKNLSAKVMYSTYSGKDFAPAVGTTKQVDGQDYNSRVYLSYKF